MLAVFTIVLYSFQYELMDKSSAVAEMGDRLTTVDESRKVWGGAAVPLSVGELGPHLTECCPGRGLPLYQVAS